MMRHALLGSFSAQEHVFGRSEVFSAVNSAQKHVLKVILFWAKKNVTCLYRVACVVCVWRLFLRAKRVAVLHGLVESSRLLWATYS